MPANYLTDDPAGGEKSDPPTVDDPDDFGPWLLHVPERAGRGMMTHLKLRLSLRFERSLTMRSESLPPDRESVELFDLHDDGYTLATFVYNSRDELVSVDLGDGRGPRPPAPLFHWQHDPDKRLFKLTLTDDGKTEYWRDNPTRYLVVEPDPTTGTVKAVLKRGRPVYLWLCREEREAR